MPEIIRLPIFNPTIDLTPLEDLTAELALARTCIMRADALIDQTCPEFIEGPSTSSTA